MKAVRLYGPGDLRVCEEPQPQPGPGEVLVQVRAVGICGSDLQWFGEAGIGDARLDHPLILGHEFAGEIASGPRQGERVAVDPAVPCGRCEFCLRGNPNFCTHLRFAGHGANDGAMREMIAWPEECLYTLPDELSDADGAMLEPLGVALHAVDLGKVRVGMTVGVFGAGPIGLLVAQLALRSGAKSVYITDPLPHRLEVARALGVTRAILTQAGAEVQEIAQATAGRGLDVTFECAGENRAVESAIDAVVSGGRVVLVGIPADDRTSFTASIARRKGLTIKLVRRMKHTYPRAIGLVENGQIDVRSLVTHTFPLESAQEAFSVAQRREGIKIIIQV